MKSKSKSIIIDVFVILAKSGLRVRGKKIRKGCWKGCAGSSRESVGCEESRYGKFWNAIAAVGQGLSI